MTKEYVCCCGKIFYNSQAFNGHKGHCSKHQLDKHGSLDAYSKHIDACIKAVSKRLRCL